MAQWHACVMDHECNAAASNGIADHKCGSTGTGSNVTAPVKNGNAPLSCCRSMVLLQSTSQHIVFNYGIKHPVQLCHGDESGQH